MKIKKVPMRTCVVSGEKCEKKDLIRIVRKVLERHLDVKIDDNIYDELLTKI